jgi:nucleotidyltransferase substrate binding protein (TIGR01987 family)
MKDKRPLQLQIWKQALDRLCEVLAKPAHDRIVIDAAIQRFEFCFELGWKTIKAFLEFQGQKLALPREVIAAAYRVQWISDEPGWLQMMDDRNLSSHTYHQPLADAIYSRLPLHQLRMLELLALLDRQLSNSLEV